ncbi:MAG: glycosyl transferase group 1 [Verrucomicrobia bacterium]|jgi:glycosyltransferase involved in cell wall biosynthesis|nr:glycosyl transferase group 1 [Verrucomicrobiota bacterium]
MSKPAKILWISCVGEKGGAEVYMNNLLRRLDRTRFEPHVALLRPGPLAQELQAMDVRVHEFPAHRMRHLGAVTATIQQLVRLIEREEISLVHSNGFRAHVYGGLAAWLAGVPECWLVHTAEVRHWSTWAIQRIPTAHVQGNCHRTVDYFVERGFPTTLVWPSVDLDQLQQQTSRADLALKFSLSPGARWLVMAARLQRYKGHAYFLQALATLPEDVHGIILGGSLFGMEPEYRLELETLAGQLGLRERVHFTGFVSDEELHGFLAQAEAVVHPALDEDFGLSVAEAQALGRPVIAFAAHGPQAIIVDEVTGRLVPVGDQRGLDQALQQALNSPARLAAWGAAARLRAEERFSAAAAVAQLEAIYTACLRNTSTAH